MPLSRRRAPFAFRASATPSTVANTTAETDFGQQHIIQANTLKVGKSYRVKGYGVYSTLASAAGTETVRVKLGSVVLGTTGGFTASLSKTNAPVLFELLFTVVSVGASGSVEAQGQLFNETANATMQAFSLENTAALTVDTTTDQTLRVSQQWSVADAANTMTLRLLSVEELG